MENFNTQNKKPIFKSRSVPIGVNTFLPSKKEEILTERKISLETLLDEIKDVEIKILSDNQKSKNKTYKDILLELKENLDISLNEKNSNSEYLQKKISQIKKPLQNKIYIESKNTQEKNKFNNKKNINIYNLKSERELLEMLNFKVENDVKQINNTIFLKKEEIDYLNLCMEYPYIEEKVTMCNQQKYFPFISKLLCHKLNKLLKKLKFTGSLKQYQNDEIEGLIQNITRLKNFISIKNNGYVENNKIIQEESKDITNNISTYTLNNINNIINMYKQMRQTEEDEKEEDNIIILNEEDNNNKTKADVNDAHEYIPSFNSKKNEDTNINDNKRNIQQFINLNMNINLNVNYDNYNYDKIKYNEEMRYNSDRDFNPSKKNHNKIGQDSEYSSSNSLPNLINDSVKEIKNSKFK